MNGAMFGTTKVLSNFVNMISCRRTTHGLWSQSLMLVFMIYQTSLFALQFFLVGALFAATYAFFDQLIASLFAQNPQFANLYNNGTLMTIYVYVYILLLCMCLIVSLAMPLDKAKPCFNIATTIFGLISIMSVVGMCFYLAAAGFYPYRSTYDPYSNTWTQHDD